MVQIGYVMKNLTNALEAESILGLFRYCPELPTHTAQKEEFKIQILAYRRTVYNTGKCTKILISKLSDNKSDNWSKFL